MKNSVLQKWLFYYLSCKIQFLCFLGEERCREKSQQRDLPESMPLRIIGTVEIEKKTMKNRGRYWNNKKCQYKAVQSKTNGKLNIDKGKSGYVPGT